MIKVAHFWRIILFVCVLFARKAVCYAARRPLFILVDGFTDYISGYCRDYCKSHNIEVMDVLSPYTCRYLEKTGTVVPYNLRGPADGDELAWIDAMELNDVDRRRTFCLAESDAGLSTAERIQSALRLTGNGISPHLRNKFLMNEKIRKAGLKTVEQCFAKSWEEAEGFIQRLWASRTDQKGNISNIAKNNSVVIKPYRGVASDGVYLCHSLHDAKNAFRKLFGTSRYGGGIQDAVLVQEYADGLEYAVDTVTLNGETKVVALWKYEKFSANGAPFCYQCTNLIPATGSIEVEICEYCIDCLKALNLQSGPTHTEIKYTNDGPRLIEVNARWHAQNFIPIVKDCLGYDAVTVTMESLFDSESFRIIPRLPAYLSSYGRIVHLISYKSGIIHEIRHLETINSLSSVRYIHLPLEVGDQLEKTVDIRTDCGYVLLINEDLSLLESDYRVITALQKTMFEVYESFPNHQENQQQQQDQFIQEFQENESYQLQEEEDSEMFEEPQQVFDDIQQPPIDPSGVVPYQNIDTGYPRPLDPNSPMLQSIESPEYYPNDFRQAGSFFSSLRAIFNQSLKFLKKFSISLAGLYIMSQVIAHSSPFIYLIFLPK